VPEPFFTTIETSALRDRQYATAMSSSCPSPFGENDRDPPPPPISRSKIPKVSSVTGTP